MMELSIRRDTKKTYDHTMSDIDNGIMRVQIGRRILETTPWFSEETDEIKIKVKLVELDADGFQRTKQGLILKLSQEQLHFMPESGQYPEQRFVLIPGQTFEVDNS